MTVSVQGSNSKKSELNPYANKFWYVVSHVASRLFFKLVWRRKVIGLENVPATSLGRGIVFAANHRSLIDPPLIGSSVPFELFFFAKAELFDVPLLGWILLRLISFLVKRLEHDVGAFKKSLRILESGKRLLLFPEGGRRLQEGQWLAKPGVGMLSIRTRSLVIPVLISNSDRLIRFPQVTVKFGLPIEPPEDSGSESYRQFSDHVMQKIKELGETS